MTPRFGDDVIVDGVRGREENIPFAILAGVVAATVGAAIWMGITVVTNMHIGYVALGVGALVGLAVRIVGHGRSIIFGLIGAVLTLAGCLGGEILTVVQLSTTAQHDFYDTLTHLDLTQTLTNIFNQTDPLTYLTYLIYAIGIFEGYKFSIRK